MEKSKTAYQELEEGCRRELEFLNTEEGQEIQLCMVAQGYEDIIFGRYMVVYSSGFTAMEIIKDIRKKLKWY